MTAIHGGEQFAPAAESLHQIESWQSYNAAIFKVFDPLIEETRFIGYGRRLSGVIFSLIKKRQKSYQKT